MCRINQLTSLDWLQLSFNHMQDSVKHLETYDTESEGHTLVLNTFADEIRELVVSIVKKKQNQIWDETCTYCRSCDDAQAVITDFKISYALCSKVDCAKAISGAAEVCEFSCRDSKRDQSRSAFSCTDRTWQAPEIIQTKHSKWSLQILNLLPASVFILSKNLAV